MGGKVRKLAQKLGQRQPFTTHRDAWANLHLLGQTDSFLAPGLHQRDGAAAPRGGRPHLLPGPGPCFSMQANSTPGTEAPGTSSLCKPGTFMLRRSFDRKMSSRGYGRRTLNCSRACQHGYRVYYPAHEFIKLGYTIMCTIIYPEIVDNTLGPGSAAHARVSANTGYIILHMHARLSSLIRCAL